MNNGLTQHQKIVGVFCSRPAGHILYAKDFQDFKLGDFFVGYEATARLSEVDGLNPGMFERVKSGRFIGRRMRWEAIAEWYPRLTPELKLMFKRANKTPSDPQQLFEGLAQ